MPFDDTDNTIHTAIQPSALPEEHPQELPIEDGLDYGDDLPGLGNPPSAGSAKPVIIDTRDDEEKEGSELDKGFALDFDPATFEGHSPSEEDPWGEPTKPARIPANELPGCLKGRVEAVLFITGRPLQVGEVAEKLQAHYDDVEEALLELINDYSCRENCALEIDDTDGYILQVRSDYNDVVNEMLPADISIGALRTLSAIALKGPILQSKLVEIRGSGVYDHIKELARQQLVSKKREQSSYTLKVTNKFHRYFRIEANQLTSILSSR
jgi:segregation and condensation protein B